MKRKLIFKILRILGLCLFMIFVAGSVYTAHSVNSRNNFEPALVYLDKLPESKSEEPPFFKYQICPKFGVKVSSEAVEEPYPEMPHMCVVTYKGQRFVISNIKSSMESDADFFRNSHLKFTYGHLDNRDLMGVMYELPVPEHRLFYYRQKHFDDAVIYFLRSLDRSLNKSATYKKYGHPVFNIYVWDRPLPENPGYQRVEIFSNDLALSCIGEVCLEYLQAIEIL